MNSQKTSNWLIPLIVTIIGGVILLSIEYSFFQSSTITSRNEGIEGQIKIEDSQKNQKGKLDDKQTSLNSNTKDSESEHISSVRENNNYVYDPDSNRYKIVQIVDKVWLAENLNLRIDGANCYNEEVNNCRRYGSLYTWEAAQKACHRLGPGWRLPLKAEWLSLIDNYGGFKNAYNLLIEGGNAGFDAALGGQRTTLGEYTYIGEGAGYWSGTKGSWDNVLFLAFTKEYKRISPLFTKKSSQISCRCIKD